MCRSVVVAFPAATLPAALSQTERMPARKGAFRGVTVNAGCSLEILECYNVKV